VQELVMMDSGIMGVCAVKSQIKGSQPVAALLVQTIQPLAHQSIFAGAPVSYT
jgi:hypothetical protein